ncbi:MAG: hypothetical protein HOE90_16060 [Bacteriovoracaceae bacterium]|jgi:hypothetical protein|nr:hypothetical protein [Bacteriovoracaceae bacterium]
MELRTIIYIYPISAPVAEVKKVYEEDQANEIFEVDNVDEAIQIFLTSRPAVIISSDPKKLIYVLAKAKKDYKNSNSLSVLITSKSLNFRVKSKFEQLGLTDNVHEPIAATALQYKLDKILKLLPAKDSSDSNLFEEEKDEDEDEGENVQNVQNVKSMLKFDEDPEKITTSEKNKFESEPETVNVSHKDRRLKFEAEDNSEESAQKEKIGSETELSLDIKSKSKNGLNFEDQDEKGPGKEKRDKEKEQWPKKSKKSKKTDSLILEDDDTSKDKQTAKEEDWPTNESKKSNSSLKFDNIEANQTGAQEKGESEEQDSHKKKKNQNLILEKDDKASSRSKKETNPETETQRAEGKDHKLNFDEEGNKDPFLETEKGDAAETKKKQVGKLELKDSGDDSKKNDWPVPEDIASHAKIKKELNLEEVPEIQEEQESEESQKGEEKSKKLSELQLEADQNQDKKEKQPQEEEIKLDKKNKELQLEEVEQAQKEKKQLLLEAEEKKREKENIQTEEAEQERKKKALILEDEEGVKKSLELENDQLAENEKKKALQLEEVHEESEFEEATDPEEVESKKKRLEIELEDDSEKKKKQYDEIEIDMSMKKGTKLQEAESSVEKKDIEDHPLERRTKKEQKTEKIELEEKEKQNRYLEVKKQTSPLQSLDENVLNLDKESLEVAPISFTRFVKNTNQGHSHILSPKKAIELASIEQTKKKVDELQIEDDLENLREEEVIENPHIKMQTYGIETIFEITSLLIDPQLSKDGIIEYTKSIIFNKYSGFSKFFVKSNLENQTALIPYIQEENSFAPGAAYFEENAEAISALDSTELPQWEENTEGDSKIKTRLVFPYFEGNLKMGMAVCYFENGISEENSKIIENILFALSSLYLESMKDSGVSGEYSGSKSDQKTGGKKSIWKNLFGSKKAS